MFYQNRMYDLNFLLRCYIDSYDIQISYLFQVKKRQQRVMMILESKNVKYEVIDITEPGREAEKEFMQMNSMARESKYPLPPQVFNDEDYCGVSWGMKFIR